jgi:hypothetical protein
VKVREVLSSTPRTRYVSEGPMVGMGARFELMVINCVWRRDASRVMLAREGALPERQRAPVMLTVISDVDGHTCVGADEVEFPEMDGHVGG